MDVIKEQTIFKWIDNRVLIILMLATGAFLLYGKTISYGYAIDDHYILQNLPDTGSILQDLKKIFSERFNNSDYRPVLILSYYLEKGLTGQIHPGFSHFVSVLLYSLTVLLVYFLSEKHLPATHKNFPFFISLLFLVHPIHANVVCNLKSRDNLLSLLFGLLSSHFIYDFFVNKKNVFKLLTGYLLFLIALCSKLDAMGFVVFISLLMLIRKINLFKVLLNLALMLLILYVIRLGLLPHTFQIDTSLPQAHVTFTENPLILNATLPDKLAAGIQTGWVYLLFMLKPYGYYFYYGYDQIQLLKFNNFQVSLYLLLQLSIVLLSIFSYRKNKIVFLGVLSFYGFLAYCLNVFEPVAGIIADRYAFIASLSFCITIAGIVYFFKQEYRKYFYYFLLTYSLVLAVFSFQRVSAWKDKLTLIETDIPHLSRSYEAQRIAASTYMENFELSAEPAIKNNYLQKALEHAQNANAIYPPNALMHKMEGVILFNLHEYDKAKEALTTSLKNDSASTETLEMLGDIYFVQKKYTEAQFYYTTARKSDPGYNQLVNKISTVIYESGDRDSCRRYNTRLILDEPALWAPYENLGYFYLDQNDSVTAKKYFGLAKEKGLPDSTPL